MVRMGKRGEKLAPLDERSAMKVDGAVFRDDPVDVAPRRHHARLRPQLCHDPGDAAIGRRRGERDDRPAATAHRRGVGVAAAPWMNTFMPLEIRETTASADSARDCQDCMGDPPLAIALSQPHGSHHEPLAARSSKNVL